MNTTELPEIIAEAARTKAETLDLKDRGLTSVPPEIGQLTHLTTLVLYNNGLTSLPPEIARFAHLTTLSLENNPLPAEVKIAFQKDAGVRFMVRIPFVRRPSSIE